MYLNKKKLKAILMFFTMLVCLWGCGRIPDGEYAASVTLTGGSGRAYIESPCKVMVENGKAYADIIWSSPNYDYMIVDGKTYTPVITEGNSEFVIPVTLGKEMAVQADTTAMSTPHLIDYTLLFSLDETGKRTEEQADSQHTEISEKEIEKRLETPTVPGLTYDHTDENTYAQGFRIHRYQKGAAAITVDDGRIYLVLPENMEAPENLSSEITVIRKPLSNIYLAATSVMCHFDSLDAVETITLSGAQEEDWYIESAAEAMRKGTLIYGGKYSAPDYEMLLDSKIQLAIENTMILHAPKVQESLESFGIPVFIDRSSYEEEPLGRLEWIKIYGLLTDKETEADSFFAQQKSIVEALDNTEASGKKVAVFAVNSNHQIVTRKANDYLAKMVETAGGEYLAPESDGSLSSSQMTISVEAFFAYAKDADILIYNGTIQEAPTTIDELIKIDQLFAELKAVKDRQVWYTDKSLYQLAGRTGTIIGDLNEVICRQEKETTFFHGLN